MTRNRLGDKPYPLPTLHLRFSRLTRRLNIKDSFGRQVAVSKTHHFRHTAATNLISAGVPLHVVMRYFGHVSPDMTLHYAVTSAQTMEEEFLRYKKVTRDGRTASIDSSDLSYLTQLGKRADRILPNGWCTLPPKHLCDKGNACLSCSKFITDATHAPKLRTQLTDTETLIEHRQAVFTAKYGAPMDETNIWRQGRQVEVDSLNRILLSISDVSAADKSVRGPGTVTCSKENQPVPEHLTAAARARHTETRARADAALLALSNAGEPVTFAAVARRAKSPPTSSTTSPTCARRSTTSAPSGRTAEPLRNR